MRSNRVFVEGNLEQGAVIELGGSAATHIVRVLRLRPGDALTLFDGRGGEYAGELEGVRKEAAFVAVGAHHTIERESPLATTLAQGVSRGERMDLIVQKATELGVRHIVPVITERTVVRLDAKQANAKRRHWRAVAIAACEQCGRNSVPEVAAPVSLSEFLSTISTRPNAARIVLSPQGRMRVRDLQASEAVIVLIGPEGGMTDAELETAVCGGFQGVRLGPRILRTETAAIAALAVIQHRLGDF
jgi:16S rRNA (uracil1498-N3)-methyltransferase